MLRFAVVLLVLVAAFGPLSRTALADEGPLDTAPPKGITAEEIIRRFATKETEFQQARDQYTYRQDELWNPSDSDEGAENGEYPLKWFERHDSAVGAVPAGAIMSRRN